MNPQQINIDQLPDDALAIHGWNHYRALESARRQVQLCEQNILAISQELDRRAQAKQQEAGKEEAGKKIEQDLLVDKLMAKLAGRNGVSLPKAQEEAPKAEGA